MREQSKLKEQIRELNERVDSLEMNIELYRREICQLETVINNLRDGYAKEIANYLANETFITRMSEDMFMTVAKKEFRERWAK